MDYINYIYEAVYFFNRIHCYADKKARQQINQEERKGSGINESAYRAAIRILVVNNLLDYDGGCLVMTREHSEKHRFIMDQIRNGDQNNHYQEMFNKGVNEVQFFFDSISELEYEIYSRCNFTVTFEIGMEAAKHVNLADKKVLELGGNSGGLGTALLTKNEDCLYSIVDTKIPCMVGREFRELNKKNIAFIEGDIFELMLSKEVYDYVILMNLLHDFDDMRCRDILHSCIRYCDRNTKFLIIEDVLSNEFEPKEIIRHGLRLSVECRGGKQRTIEEMVNLFLKINYGLEKTIKLDNTQTMLVMGNL